ncbi:Fc.00g003850.m01.CDS01 [Cosmosporella sp. VM-42]
MCLIQPTGIQPLHIPQNATPTSVGGIESLDRMSKRLCSICNTIFTGEQTLNHEQPHHQSSTSFLDAASEGCYICRTITASPDWESVASQEAISAVWYLSSPSGSPPGFFRLSIDTLGEGEEGSVEGEEEDEVISDEQETVDELPDEASLIPAAWGFHLQLVSDLTGSVRDYSPPENPQEPPLAQLARTWFEECCEGHPSCGPREPSFRPTRLVEIEDESTVRVVLARDNPDVGAYAAFSHCWGKSKALKLLRDNVPQLCDGIMVNGLPISYREAIDMCRTLSIRYIWIDSMCIIQDDEEDWHREAATMKDVYRNSSLNICACAAAESSEASFASRDCSLISPLVVAPSWSGLNGKSYYLSDAEIYQKDIEDSPLRTRAWVLQEVWLSRRSLSLTKNQLWWECRQRRACESFPGGLPSAWLSQDLANDLNFYNIHPYDDAGNEESRTLVQLYRSWSKLVEFYSRCGLTMMLDKMMAFSGIAQGFKQTETPDDQYVAGLWRKMLPASLYWSTTKLDWTRRPEVYRAPSWSWASIEGAVGFPPDLDRDRNGQSDVSPLCSILDVQLNLVDEDHETGLLRGGAIEIQGRIIGPVTTEAPEYTLRCICDLDKELQESLRVSRWAFDETTENGDDALSYLDGFDSELCRRGILDGAARETIIWEAGTAVELFCLPIFESFHGDGQSVRGLLLCRVKGQPKDVYHRVGEFSHMPMLKDGLGGIVEKKVVLL